MSLHPVFERRSGNGVPVCAAAGTTLYILLSSSESAYTSPSTSSAKPTQLPLGTSGTETDFGAPVPRSKERTKISFAL